MKDNRLSRRQFIRNTSIIAGTTVAGSLASDASASGAKDGIDPKKVVNYNEKMNYRRLGKTNLMLSEVSLGGHWKNRGGGRYWDTFADDQSPADVAKNRSDVVSACIDVGINYLDITTAAECLAYGAAIKGRRDKMIVGADDHRLGPRNPANRNVKALTFNIDECLRRLNTDYLDIWRVQADMGGNNSDEDVEIMIEAFQKAHKAGKALHFGISSHSRPWAQHVIEKHNEVEMFIFPCTAKTREKGQTPVKENVVEENPGHGSDQTQSIFEALRKGDVGLVTIKPFFGGSLFKIPGAFPVMGVGDKSENDLARLTLQCILSNDVITATVPGLTTPYEVENAALAAYTRPVAKMTAADEKWLADITERQWQDLPAEYRWLHDWEVV
jgi:aryl-alcohol dehydrogenase-like predicted oxidoreductase